MWESISQMATNPVTIAIIAALLLVIIIIAIVAIKKGWIKIRTKNVAIGSDIERNIILTQMKKVENTVMSVYKKWNFQNDNWKARFIASEIEDSLYRAIGINHINTCQTYIQLKQEEIWKVICQYTDSVDDKLKENIYSETEKLIRELVEIRDFLLKKK